MNESFQGLHGTESIPRSHAAVRALGLPVAAELDLGGEDEANRGAIHRLAVVHLWIPDVEGASPQGTPEEAELAVTLFCGRWFVSFLELEDADSGDLPEAEKRNLSRVVRDAGAPRGLAFRRC